MRTVTFAKPELIDELKDRFILVWHNQSPDLYGNRSGEQEKLTEEQLKAYPQGGGGGNVRTYFLNPSGEIYYYLEGYWSSERYLVETRFAFDLAAKLRDAADAKQRGELARAALKTRVGEIAAERDALKKKHPGEFEKKVFDSEIRKREAALGLLEKTLAGSMDLVDKLADPILEEIRRQNLERGVIK